MVRRLWCILRASFVESSLIIFELSGCTLRGWSDKIFGRSNPKTKSLLRAFEVRVGLKPLEKSAFANFCTPKPLPGPISEAPNTQPSLLIGLDKGAFSRFQKVG